MWRVVVRPAPWVLSALIALACTSCQRGVPCYPVHGQVFVNGKPAAGVTVVFHPLDNADPNPVLPSAVVEEDGSFTLKSFFVQDRTLKDGAPAGKYRVTCVWYPKDLQKHLGQEHLPDRLLGRYADPKTTGLTAEVLEQSNELAPFKLDVPEK